MRTDDIKLMITGIKGSEKDSNEKEIVIHGQYMTFSDGAGTLKFNDIEEKMFNVLNISKFVVEVSSSIRCDSIFSILLQLEDIFRELKPALVDKKILILKYFPYARADRKFENNMCVPKNVFLNFVSKLGYNCIITDDMHSDVNNTNVKILNDMISAIGLPKDWKDVVICSPDRGAVKRCSSFLLDMVLLNSEVKFSLAICDKKRDVSTGGIIGHELISGDVKGKKVIIVDDICDGGRTFISCAKILKELGAEELGLYVTHGIFSNGIDELTKYFSFIRMKNYVNQADQKK